MASMGAEAREKNEAEGKRKDGDPELAADPS